MLNIDSSAISKTGRALSKTLTGGDNQKKTITNSRVMLPGGYQKW
jgi:hypothetical protein